MREHRLAGHIADRQNVRISGPHLLVDLHEAFVVDLDLRVFEAEAAAVWSAADGDEHAIKLLGAEFPGALKSDLDFVVSQAERADFGVQENSLAEERV